MSEHIKQNRVVEISKLHPHPRNYRQHPEVQVSKLVSSLVRFGQGRSIVAQDGPQGYLIVAGHGIVEAARKLDYTELRADILPADWSPEQVEGYLVADNMHSQDAEDDQEALAQILQEQQNAGFDLASLGTDNESLRQLLESLGDEYLDKREDIDPREDIDKTPDERLDAFLHGTIRQIVLLFTPEEFSRMLARFKQIRNIHKDLETNTDVVKYLTDYYIEQEQLPDVEPAEVEQEEDT